MTMQIELGRHGKDALKKACRNHPSWKRWIVDNMIEGAPTKAQMLDFADHTDIKVQGIMSRYWHLPVDISHCQVSQLSRI